MNIFKTKEEVKITKVVKQSKVKPICKNCDGRGMIDETTCPVCKGTGRK